VEHLNVLKDYSNDEGPYLFATLVLSYNLKGRHEVLGCQYYSGPVDCVGVHYTIRSLEGQTDDALVDKIKSFFKANTRTYGVPADQEPN
jgi:hypothetical protein